MGNWKNCILIISIFLASCATTKLGTSSPDKISYFLDASESVKNKGLISIELTVPQHITKFKAPDDYGGAPMFLSFVSQISAKDSKGQVLKVERSKNTIEVMEVKSSYKLKYLYKVPQAISGEVDQSLPNLNSEYGRFDNNTTFLIPVGNENLPASLMIESPKGWPIYTGWGEGNKFENLKANEVTSGMIAMGKFKFSSTMAGKTKLNFGIIGDFDHEVLKKQFKQVFLAQQEIGGQLPNKEFLVVFQPTVKGCCKGTSLKSALVVNMPSNIKLVPFNLPAIGTASHELFHQWNFQYIYPESEDGVYLFSEGFTNYFAVAALSRAKLIKPESFAWFLWHYRNLLEKNPKYKTANYEKIQSGFKTNDDDLVSLAYTKGPFVAVLLDVALREDTKHRESLKSWFKKLGDRFGAKKGYSTSDLRNLLVEVSGSESSKTVRTFDSAFMGSGELELNKLFSRLGFTCVNKTKKCTLKKLKPEMASLREKIFSARN